MENKKLILDKENIKYMLEKTLNFSTKKKQRSENGSCINDNTISKEKTWSSEKIEDFTLKNIETTWTETKGVNPSVDFTKEGHMKEVEIFGNTWQDKDGKNLFDSSVIEIHSNSDKILTFNKGNYFIKVKPETKYSLSDDKNYKYKLYCFKGDKRTQINAIYPNAPHTFTTPEECEYIKFTNIYEVKEEKADANVKIQFEEGSVATPYEPYHKADLSDIRHVGELQEDGRYKIEIITKDKNFVSLEGEEVRTSKQTLLLPCQLSKVGDVSDKLYWNGEKYVIEKNVHELKMDDIDTISTVEKTEKSVRLLYNIKFHKNTYRGIPITNNLVPSDVCWIHNAMANIHIKFNNGTDFYDELYKKTEQEIKEWFIAKKVVGYVPVNLMVNKPEIKVETGITEEIFPTTYKDKTYIFVNGGQLDGEIKGKVPVDAGKAITALTERNNTLKKESENIQFINEIQEELININMLATDEIYIMLEPLLSEVETEMLNVEISSKIVLFYVAMVRKGLKTINTIPKRYRLGVMEVLAKLE